MEGYLQVLGAGLRAWNHHQATKYLKNGTNKIEIEVVNLWRNQLIKDKKIPKEERNTWLLIDDIKKGEKLQPSGLIGPVSIEKIKY